MELAACGGNPVNPRRDDEWPAWPRPSSDLLRDLQRVAESGCWTASGVSDATMSLEHQFAQQFARYHRVPFCVPTVNGTTAIRLILLALGVGYGDEFILPGLTWVSCATAVTDVGAIPVFADVDVNTACIDPEQIDDLKTSRTAAVMAVHLYCNVANLAAIQAKCNKYGLALIEDCDQSHGAEWNTRRVGTIGTAGAFSMHQGKPLTCGEGRADIKNCRCEASRFASHCD